MIEIGVGLGGGGEEGEGVGGEGGGREGGGDRVGVKETAERTETANEGNS